MQILITRDNFSTDRYRLRLNDTALDFIDEDGSFSLPYSEIKDFCVLHDKRNKRFFSMIGNNELYEGQILESSDMEEFTESLREKLNGIISLQVKKQ